MPPIDTSSGFPALVSNFRVEVGRHVLPLASISTLTDVIADKARIQPPESYSQPTVRLTRAVTQDHFLYNWFRDSRLGKDTRTDVAVILLDSPDGKEINRWILRNAHPIKWSGPLFDALGNELATEALDIIYDFVDWPNT